MPFGIGNEVIITGPIVIGGPISVTQGTIPWVVDAVNFDIRDLNSAQDSVTCVQGTSPWVVSALNLDIRDLNSATDSVTVIQGTSPWTVAATNFDIRDLVAATDSVTAFQGGAWAVGQSGAWTVAATQSGVWNVGVTGTVTVNAVNLDIRDLSFISDSVTAFQGGAWSVGVTGTVAVTGPLTDAELRATPVPVTVAGLQITGVAQEKGGNLASQQELLTLILIELRITNMLLMEGLLTKDKKSDLNSLRNDPSMYDNLLAPNLIQ
jgi:hypothetical protein